MSKSGQGAGRPPLANIAAGSSRSAQPEDSDFAGKAALGLVGLGLVGHVLRSRRFYQRVIVGAIVLGVLRGLGQESGASTMARLQTWNKQQVQLLERKSERQARRLERKARRLERQAKRQTRRLTVWAKLRIRRPRAEQRTAS